jgi:PKD repeat protein
MPLQVQFTNLSGGDISTYNWMFGDGGVSTEKNPSHVYAKKGTYSVILTVIGTDNTKTATKTRDTYIDVKGKCFLASSLDSPGQIEALRAITLGAAVTLKLDAEIGSIECGKRADFAVLEDDPRELGPARLKDARIWGTVQGGRVFEAAKL